MEKYANKNTEQQKRRLSVAAERRIIFSIEGSNMKIYLCRKSIFDLKKTITKEEYKTTTSTVKELLFEMVAKNYAAQPMNETLEDCLSLVADEFSDGGFYVVNKTKNIRYTTIEQNLLLSEEDELVFIKLKYIRGLVW